MSDWDIVKALRNRAEMQTATGITEPSEHIDWMAADEIEKLRAAMHDIYEVYAGSEGIPRPVTCSEAYLYELVREMARIAAKHKRAAAAALKETSDD